MLRSTESNSYNFISFWTWIISMVNKLVAPKVHINKIWIWNFLGMNFGLILLWCWCCCCCCASYKCSAVAEVSAVLANASNLLFLLLLPMLRLVWLLLLQKSCCFFVVVVVAVAGFNFCKVLLKLHRIFCFLVLLTY